MTPHAEPSPNQDNEEQTTPKWKPMQAHDRRVFGVLIEKAKTTPDAYPLSLNALRNGCNQKSNRYPQTQLEEDDIDEAMERLRLCGAAVVIQGGHRIDKARHLAYEWLGVDKVEVSVMAELLLRGSQTLGELRARASRMEPIAGLSELKPILASLLEKNLIVYLTPPGRGAIVTHNLYLEREMDRQKRDYSGGAEVTTETPRSAPVPQPVRTHSPTQTKQEQPTESSQNENLSSEVCELRQEVALLREEVEKLKASLEAALG